jgi:hypothetical protein
MNGRRKAIQEGRKEGRKEGRGSAVKRFYD